MIEQQPLTRDAIATIICDLQKKAMTDTAAAIVTTMQITQDVAGPGGVMSVMLPSMEVGLEIAAIAWQYLVDGSTSKHAPPDARLVVALMAARHGLEDLEGEMTFDDMVKIGRQFRAVTGREMVVPELYRRRR